VDIQAMLWIGDAWNIDDIHHRLLWDGNDGRAACQSRHVAAKSNLRHTRDIYARELVWLWMWLRCQGFLCSSQIQKGPHRHLALPIKHPSPNILQVLLHIGKTTRVESGLMAILSIVLGHLVAENVAYDRPFAMCSKKNSVLSLRMPEVHQQRVFFYETWTNLSVLPCARCHVRSHDLRIVAENSG
jgi:hypothetical protein